MFVIVRFTQGRAYFLSAGFSLAFGAMFTKTFRVHRIFSRRNSLLKNKVSHFSPFALATVSHFLHLDTASSRYPADWSHPGVATNGYVSDRDLGGVGSHGTQPA